MSDDRTVGGQIVRSGKSIVLVLDVVESVRLVSQDELGLVNRWLLLVAGIETAILPSHNGSLAKKLGDGLILEFCTVRDALDAALAIIALSEADNAAAPADQTILMRFAIHVCALIDAGGDLYGHDLNVAMRLVSLARPGEIVASDAARDELVSSLDADIEDLGNCYLKHIAEPVRAYRCGPPSAARAPEPAIDTDDLMPVLAVVPFASITDAVDLGEIVAEELIVDIGRSHDVRVISRLSTTAMRGRDLSVKAIAERLGADYVLCGTCRSLDDRLAIDVELAEAGHGDVVWSERVMGAARDILDPSAGFLSAIASEVRLNIEAREVRLARTHSLRNLRHYTLMMAAIALMHRLSPAPFGESRRILDALIERATRQALPNAWLGKWHVLKVQQGWADDPDREATLAAQATRTALEVDPECSLALSIDGFVKTNLLKRLDLAKAQYDLAIDIQPSNSLAWLLRGTMHVFRGEGSEAVANIEQALRLSPLDPHRFFYDALAAGAYFADARYDVAIEYARASLRLNRYHASTLRILAVALLRTGRGEEAARTASLLREVEPNLTVANWLHRSPSADFKIGRDFARSLQELGFPSH